MKRVVTAYVRHLRTKPEDERVRYAYLTAGACVVVLGSIWLVLFVRQLRTPTVIEITPGSTAPFWREQVTTLLEEARAKSAELTPKSFREPIKDPNVSSPEDVTDPLDAVIHADDAPII
jgi:hypothetical protein